MRPSSPPPPASPTTYSSTISKGTSLLTQLSHSSPHAIPPSTYTQTDDLATHGYLAQNSAFNMQDKIKSLDDLQRAIEGLGISHDFDGMKLGLQAPRSEQDSCGTERFYAETHCWKVFVGGDGMSGGGEGRYLHRGFFSQVINPIDGILIARHNKAPAYHSVDDEENPPFALPELHHWSDLAFLQYARARERAGVSLVPWPLRYVFRNQITNKDTLSILQKILHDWGRDEFGRWPGITFDIESKEARAILATPNGSGVVWLLAQHKEQFGNRMVEKVQVFLPGEEGEEGVRYPTLLFHIV